MYGQTNRRFFKCVEVGMKRVIVTGANGFIGRRLIEKLIDNNVDVVAIDINFKTFDPKMKRKMLTLEIDLVDEKKLLDNIPVAEYDVFFHLAWKGVNGIEKANPIIQLENTKMSMNCASVAKKIGCKKLLVSGTIAEQAINSLPKLMETTGGMMYGAAKHCTRILLETYCKNLGQDFIWMQFSNIYGPTNKTGNLVSYTIEQLSKGNEAMFGPALQPYDFIFVDDLIEAVYRLGNTEKQGDFYFIGSGEPRALREYLIEIGELYGRKDLIKIGARADDGIEYQMDMFKTQPLLDAIGNYVSMNFSDGIKYTLENY